MPSMCRDAGSRRKNECTDPIRLTSLARCLGKCKSTPDLSFAAVSLLTKTLTARATRLETSTSKARLAADKEAFRARTVNKRRRETGPKNASEFMQQTIRNRRSSNAYHKSLRESKNRDESKNREGESKQITSRTTGLPFSADMAECPGRVVFNPRRQGPSWGNAPCLPQRGDDARACRIHDSMPMASNTSRIQRRARSAGPRRRDPATWSDSTCEERLSQLDHNSFRSHDSWNLEDDEDIRNLLHIEQQQPTTFNNTRTSKPGSNDASSGSRCSAANPRPASCAIHNRLRATTRAAAAVAAAAAARDNASIASLAGGKGHRIRRRPHTAVARSRTSEAETLSSLSTGRSEREQQAREERERISRGVSAEGQLRGDREMIPVGRGVSYVDGTEGGLRGDGEVISRAGGGSDGAEGELRGERERLSRGGGFVDRAEGQLSGERERLSRGGEVVDRAGGQLRGERERLGRGVVVNGVEIRPYEVTAMGRKVHPLDRATDRPERWLPAKTLDGLDRLQRSRMLASKRPEVTGPSVWARHKRRGDKKGHYRQEDTSRAECVLGG